MRRFVPGMGTPFAMISNKSLLIIGSNRFFDDDLELNFNLLVNLEDTGESQLTIFSDSITSLSPGDEVGVFDGDLLLPALSFSAEQKQQKL